MLCAWAYVWLTHSHLLFGNDQRGEKALTVVAEIIGNAVPTNGTNPLRVPENSIPFDGDGGNVAARKFRASGSAQEVAKLFGFGEKIGAGLQLVEGSDGSAAIKECRCDLSAHGGFLALKIKIEFGIGNPVRNRNIYSCP